MRLSPAMSRGAGSAWVRHGAGIVTIVLGGAALIAGFWTQFGTRREITDVSDLRIVLPFAAATLIAGVVSFIRRERLPGLAVGGLAMAAAAPFLGWVVLVAAVAAVAIVILVIFAKFQ